jgi:hypothetical protein
LEPLVNLGTGRLWTGNYQEKISFLKSYLAKSENQEKVVIFTDGEDVILGGCDKTELLQKYNKIVQKSGAPIVFGAELWCFEPPNGKCPEPERAAWAQKEYGHKELDQKLFSWQDQKSAADKATSYTNLNSGFFMGPAKDLLKMMEYSTDGKNWYNNHRNTDYYGDQRMYSQYWFENQDKVTLDYGQELVLVANGFKQGSLGVNGEGQVINNMFNRKQCVVHGNGYSKAFVGDIQLKRAQTKGEKAVELILKQRCVAMPETCTDGHAKQNILVQKKNFVDDIQEELSKLKTVDPLAFKETMEKYVSGNPVFLQMAEQLL